MRSNPRSVWKSPAMGPSTRSIIVGAVAVLTTAGTILVVRQISAERPAPSLEPYRDGG